MSFSKKSESSMPPFTRIPNEIIRSKILDHYDKTVFIAIASCGDNAFPSYSCLRQWTGLSVDRIWKSLKKLEQHKYIVRFKMGRSVHYKTRWSNSKIDKEPDALCIRYTETSPIRGADRTYTWGGNEPIRGAETIKTQDKDSIKSELHSFSEAREEAMKPWRQLARVESDLPEPEEG